MLKSNHAPGSSAGGAPPEWLAELAEFRRRYPAIRTIDAIFIDMCGIARGKRLPIDDLTELYEQGINLPASIYLLDVTGDQLDVMGRGFSDGDPDGAGFPVAGTLAPAPWSEGGALGQVLMSLREPLADIVYDPRNVLAAAVEKFTAMGLTPVVACELEFYLIDKRRAENGAPQPPLLPGTNRRDSDNQVYSLEMLDYYQAFLDDVQQWSAEQGVPCSMASTEFGPAQFEINLDHRADALRAADDAALFRRLVKAAALARGMEASFMSKPYADKAGSGLHLHISLLDAQGRNIFSGNGAAGSAALLHAIGGVRQAMAQSMAVFSPSISAYRRYGPNIFVPQSACWGYNNRSVAIRVPSGPDEARRLEHRVAGAEANPYLVVAAVLAGLHHGLETQADPGPPIDGNAGTQARADLPQNIWAALDALTAGKILPDYFPGNYTALYVDAKRRELEKFFQSIAPQEYAWYL
ncbi:MAG: glutamine synthetase [Alphaproteobacteria bacterium]|nr:glutamine synthetase [Alphaproteobacteria bacterium]